MAVHWLLQGTVKLLFLVQVNFSLLQKHLPPHLCSAECDEGEVMFVGEVASGRYASISLGAALQSTPLQLQVCKEWKL